MTASETPLDNCDCCTGGPAEPAISNAAGLEALKYRISTYADVRDRVLRALPRAGLDPAADARGALDGLSVRTSDDATIALIDAFAHVADVLTFYEERIANEGYLRTATERTSVLELARAIGYELSPGVAASTYLSFTVEDVTGAPRRCLVPKGLPVQSVPPQGKAPQIFETSNEFLAYADWNALRPRLTRPAEMAVLYDVKGNRLVLLVAANSVPDGEGVTRNVTDARRLDPKATDADPVDAVDVQRIYFTEGAGALSKGDVLLFAGGEGSEREIAMRRIVEVTAEPDRKRIRVDLKPLDKIASGAKIIPYLLLRQFSFATVRLAAMPFNRASVFSNVVSHAWRERDLSALVGIQGWNRFSLARAVNSPPRPDPVSPDSGAFAFRERMAFFGHNAPKWKTLPKNPGNGDPYPNGWDSGDTGAGGGRTIWQDSQGNTNTDADAYLERSVPGLVRGSWTVFESPTTSAAPWTVQQAMDQSKADFGISGRATGLRLGHPKSGAKPDTTLATLAFRFRETTAHIASRRLEFAELPIEDPVEQGATAIELHQMVVGLAVGQPIMLTGERDDTPGVDAAEVALLTDIIHAGGRTTLILREGLKYAYVRERLSICANVVHATHGETVQEVLGSGDASRRNQHLALSKSPLTYVSAPQGAASTLEIRVNDLRWDELPSLYGAPANRQAYVVRIDDDARARVTFGDGIYGARTMTGTANITARYRSGIGPDGEVEAKSLSVLRSMPLGLRGVTNAVPASGAEGPERLADARRNAPRTVLTFDRVVSLLDFENFARTFPGIGKACADVLWIDGASVIHLTVAGATGGAPSAEVLEHLRAGIEGASDFSQRFIVSPFAPRFFTCAAGIAIDARYEAAKVYAAVENRLRAAFSFDQRQFAQSVTSAEVLAVMHKEAGVVAVDLETLAPYDDSAPASAAGGTSPVVARRAAWNAVQKLAVPAELLLINPVGIDVREMKR